MTVKNSILKPRKTAFGLPKVDLTSLIEYNFQNILKKSNSQLIIGTSVKKFIEEETKIKKIELSDKKEMKVNSIISTIPFYELKHFEQTSQKMASIFKKISQLKSAPIVCVHFWFSKKVTDDLYFSVLDSPIQWVFNVSKIRGNKTQKNQHLVISLSSAWKWIKHDREEMVSLFSKEIYKLLKINANVKITQTLIVNQPNATFRSLPGSLKLRSKNITPFKNFFLAGDWTDTGWPSTMESAARSGMESAEELLKYLKLQ
jgi:zeta-carotene desaturase